MQHCFQPGGLISRCVCPAVSFFFTRPSEPISRMVTNGNSKGIREPCTYGYVCCKATYIAARVCCKATYTFSVWDVEAQYASPAVRHTRPSAMSSLCCQLSSPKDRGQVGSNHSQDLSARYFVLGGLGCSRAPIVCGCSIVEWARVPEKKKKAVLVCLCKLLGQAQACSAVLHSIPNVRKE